MTKQERIIELLKNDSDDWEKKEVWNNYCQEARAYDSEIFLMEEMDEIYRDETPSNIAWRAEGNRFRSNHKYFIDGVYGFESTDDIDSLIDYDELADYAIEYNCDFYDSAIREILDERKI